MGAPLLSGMLVAWAIAQVATGAFFCLAFALGRREYDYLIFGVGCFALALTSVGIALGYAGGGVDHWASSSKLAHVGVIAAPAFNLHFALRYGAPDRLPRLAPAAYSLAAVFLLANLLDLWWRPGSVTAHSVEIFGVQLTSGSGTPTALAAVYYLVTGAELVATELLFWRAYRRGNREALIAFVGGLAVCVAGANDILTVTGVVGGFPFLQPHAFMLYAFAVASTLVLRYRRTVSELSAAEMNLRRTEEELRVSHAELAEVQSTLETKEQLAAVGELAASIAHEVRNPLAVIANAVAGLRRADSGSADQRMLLDIVEEEAGRLNRLVTDLLRFARPAKLRPAEVDLAELAEAVSLGASADRDVGIELRVAPVKIVADEGLLRVAIGNLLENACQASPEGGKVTLAVDEIDLDGGRHARIDVADRGAGMDEAVLARACDPFFTTRPSGTGLGLPIVQRIVRAHGGRLELASKPGEGTSARLVLPCAPGEESARTRPSGAEQEHRA